MGSLGLDAVARQIPARDDAIVLGCEGLFVSGLGGGDQEGVGGAHHALADVAKSQYAFVCPFLSYEPEVEQDASPCLEVGKAGGGYRPGLCVAEIKLDDAFLLVAPSGLVSLF